MTRPINFGFLTFLACLVSPGAAHATNPLALIGVVSEGVQKSVGIIKDIDSFTSKRADAFCAGIEEQRQIVVGVLRPNLEVTLAAARKVAEPGNKIEPNSRAKIENQISLFVSEFENLKAKHSKMEKITCWTELGRLRAQLDASMFQVRLIKSAIEGVPTGGNSREPTNGSGSVPQE